MIQPDTTFATRYRPIRRIGIGGYSEVWLAEDILAGNMPVALKIFAPDKGLDEQGIALFSKEYALVFNLNHPNLLLPKHFDVADGSPFLVLPYCEAGSAFNKIGLMTESDLARFMHQAASALAYLHSQDPPIIHQDIKPDNFLMDAEGSYLLTDFGISSKIRRTLTRSMGAQASAGTLAYMPPEKFSADKQLIKAGDIFSLGVTLYELLSGDLPFGDNGGLILKAGAEVPNLPAGFSPELNELLKRCMAKETWERPTGEELSQIAQHFLSTDIWQGPEKPGFVPIPHPTPVPPVHKPTQPVVKQEGIEIFKGFNGKYGYRYAQSKAVLAQPQYDSADVFSNGRAVVGKKSGFFGKMRFGFVDLQGNEVIPCQFPEVSQFHNEVALVFHKHWTLIDLNGSPLKHLHSFQPKSHFVDGLVVITDGIFYELMDSTGKVLTRNEYTKILKFSEGRAVVEVGVGFIGTGRRYGFIDTLGNEVIEPIFSKASPFKDGRASVVLKGKSLIIDLEGNIIT